MLEGLYDWFLTYGIAYVLIGLFIIFIIDSMIFPALPELFAVIAFSMDPTVEWGIAILFTACLGEVVGNTILYSLVKWKRLPEFISRAMKRWVGFLFLKDERILLVNRVAPVVPFTGAFIATCDWSYSKSMLYLVTGGLLKYGFLLTLVGLLHVTFDPSTAQFLTFLALVIVISLSFVSSYVYRIRLHKDKENLYEDNNISQRNTED